MQTFLFSDIEASTRLWEEHPVEMAGALATHDSILERVIERSGGKVLKTTGDGVIAVFDDAPGAVDAALGAQVALAGEPWDATGPLRVRIGIHTGETELRDGDHFGPAMNRAARIMAAGHGGQVLVSEASSSASVGRLPEGATLRDLGHHRLKDLTLPEHLFQLCHDSIEPDFPALSTLDSKPNNLPVQATPFLGRAQELSAIRLMLDSPATRLLTIAGPGGAGKTRLGLQVAAELLDSFPHGVFFIDLTAEREPDAAFEAIVRGLDLPVSGTGEPLDTLKTRLRDKRMLVLLDNFEQVTAAGTGVAELLQSAPGLKVIVTSRETLRVRAEVVYPVPPLSLPNPDDPVSAIAESEAVQLFMERGRAVRPELALSEDTGRTIAEICLRLDGLPLAIELATARLNLFTPADLLERLRDRLDILGAGGRDLPDRQRTLWGAIAWSYELLNQDECDLFELMSVFSPTGLASLEEVADDAIGARFILDSLASLVDKSLIRRDESGTSQTFSMLLMIKEYAAERLSENPDREQRIRESHAKHFSEFALGLRDALRGPERGRALEQLDTEIGNLRTAWRYWVDRGNLEQLFNLIEGLWALHEAKGWYHAAIELATDTLDVLGNAEPSPGLAAEELTLRTSLARALMAVRGYNADVEEAFKRALALTTEADSTAQRFPVLRALASYYIGTSQPGQALEIGKQLLELGEEEQDSSILVEGNYVVGSALLFVDVENCLTHLDRAIELHDPHVHASNRFRLGPNTGVVARVASGLQLWMCGGLDRSVTRLDEALDLARELDHPFSIAFALYHNGFLAISRGRFEECTGFARELASVADENDYMLWGILATVLEGVATTASGDVDEGLRMTETAVELYRGVATPPVFWPFILSLRAAVHAMAGKPERALELIDEAIGIVSTDDLAPPDFLIFRGEFLTMLPEPDIETADRTFVTAAEAAARFGFHLSELKARTRLVNLRRSAGLSPDGSEELATVYAAFTEGPEEHDVVEADLLLREDA